MKIYVQSRGFTQDDDYCWQPETPFSIKEYRVNDLIQSESPSVVLSRYGKELLLLITGLETKERTDFRDRTIRNSVVWVGKDCEENERKLRAIAACALRDELRENIREEIDHAIVFANESGFQFSAAEINKLAVEEVVSIYDFSANPDRKIGKNSKILRDELAFELERHCLPTGNGALVVVTGIKTESALMQAGVWRGLSNLVQVERWKDPYKKSPASNEAVEIASQATQRIENNTVVFLVILIVLIVSIVMFFIISQP